MVPVMIMGTLIGKKRYSVIEYLCMTLIGEGQGGEREACASAGRSSHLPVMTCG